MSVFDTSTKENPPVNSRIAWPDMLRVLAIFQVILIHVGAPIIFNEELPHSYWMAANFYESISRSCVPIFFMISGYLLLGSNEPITVFFRKRFSKVGIPVIVWTIAYLVSLQPAYRDGSMNVLEIGLSMAKTVFTGQYPVHLWFIYTLLGLYLVVPILRVLVSANPSILKYFLVLWLLANPFFSLFERISNATMTSDLRIFLAQGYIGYLILGYVLGQMNPSPRVGWAGLITFLASALTIYFKTDVLSSQAQYPTIYYYDYLHFAVILMAVGFFLWIKSLNHIISGKNTTLLRQLSEATFGIYLIHMFVFDWLRDGWFGFELYAWMADPLYMIPLTTLAIFFITLGIVLVLRKIPILKYTV